MTLKYLLLVLKDIPSSILALILLITGWRAISFIKLFKKYQPGDDEHKMLLQVGLRWLEDIPFVIMGIFTIIFPWRAVGLIYALFKKVLLNKI